MTDENIDITIYSAEPESEAAGIVPETPEPTVDESEPTPEVLQQAIPTLGDVTNVNVTIQYSIPTAGIELSEKGKHIEPISLPNSQVIATLNDPYWEDIARIHNSHGMDFIDRDDDDIRVIRARIKRFFEKKYGKTFTQEEYLKVHQINAAISLLRKATNLKAEERDPFTKEGACFEQGIRDAKGTLKPLGGTAQLSKRDSQSEPITGPRAAVELGMRLGFGTSGNFSLPNSGISVVFSNPSNSELFNLDEAIDVEKIDLGMSTLGYFFGANGQKYYSTIVNFILSKIIKKTPNFASIAELRRYIKVTDIPALAIGLSNVMYPDGYPFSTYDSHSSSEIQHGLIKPLRTLLVDNNAIPEGCKRILEKRVITPEDLIDYQHELEASFKNQFLVIESEDLPTLIKFKIPNLEEYDAQSNIWISYIEGVVGTERGQLSPQEREDIYANHVNAAIASQYLPYVEYVYMLDGEEAGSEAFSDGRYAEIVEASDKLRMVSKPEDILPLLNILSSDSQTLEHFVEAVALFRDSVSVYSVGVPEVLTEAQIAAMKLTPEEIDYYHKHPKMIPIDAISLFFHLRGRRLNNWSIVPTRPVKKKT